MIPDRPGGTWFAAAFTVAALGGCQRLDVEPGGRAAGGEAGAGGDRGLPEDGSARGEPDWRALLGRFARPECFDYAGLQGDPRALASLRAAVRWVAQTDPADLADPPAVRAFWINAYNVLVLDGALTGLSTDPAFSTAGAANDFAFFSEGRRLSGGGEHTLNAIEHGILRGVAVTTDEERALHAQASPDGEPFDARIHAALNCAARSCPPLAPAPFTGAGLDSELADRTRRWLADPVRGAGPDGISELFTWYEADFIGHAGSVAAFIEDHRDGGLEGVDLSRRVRYDWRLNACE